MRLNGEYMVYKDKTRQDAQIEFDILATQHSLDSSNFELRRLSKYELYRRETGRTVEYDNKPIEYYASSPDEAENKKGRYVADFGLGATENFGVRSALTVPAQTTTSSGEMELYNVRRLSTDTIVSAFRVPNHAAAVQKFQDFLMRTGGDNTNFRLERADRNGESTGETPAQTVPTATGAPQATAANGVPMWVIYRISDGEVVHRFADHVSSHTRTALSWLRDQNYENPAMLFRVRAMTQDEQQQAQPLPGSTADLQQQRAQGGFTGSWKVIDSATGQELYRFGGVGNNQADANRVAAEWAQRNMVSDPFEVYPIMGGQ
jgi:hypothetical protein